MTRAVLILVPPGLRSKLAAHLKNVIEPNRVFDIGDTLRRNEGEGKHILEIINEFPRDAIAQKWRKAIRSIAAATDQLPTGREEDFVILLDNSVYYKSVTREFFSPVDSRVLKNRELDFSHVVQIVDDIPDMQADLTAQNELFGDSALSYFVAEHGSREVAEAQRELESKRLYLSWIGDCILSLLSWRAQEMVIAQGIANSLDARFMVWGLKQDLGVLLAWLREQDSIYYLSHPISEPRRQEEDGRWPPIVATINSMQTSFAAAGLKLVVPTGVDELRFEKRDGHFTSRLKRRWPIPDGVMRDLGRQGIIQGDIDRTMLFSPMSVSVQGGDVVKTQSRLNGVQEYYDGVFAGIEVGIVKQIANRDHQLVWLSDGIVVIEPWSTQAHEIHGGMKKEMRYLADMNEILPRAKRKRMCVYFSNESITDVTSQESFRGEYVQSLRTLHQERYQLRAPTASSIITEEGELSLSPGGTLGPDIPPEKRTVIIRKFESIRADSLQSAFLSKTMEMTLREKNLIMPQCCPRIEDILQPARIDACKAFFRGERDARQEYDLLTDVLRLAMGMD